MSTAFLPLVTPRLLLHDSNPNRLRLQTWDQPAGRASWISGEPEDLLHAVDFLDAALHLWRCLVGLVPILLFQ